MVVDACTLGVLTAFHNTNWTYIDHIRSLNADKTIKSLFTFRRYDLPYYHLLHGHQTKIYPKHIDPIFARLVFGEPLPTANHEKTNRCAELLKGIHDGTMLPQYISLDKMETVGNGLSMELDLCHGAVKSLEKNNQKMYSVEKTF